MFTNRGQGSPATIGYVIECHGVQIRAQLRSVATLVQLTGRIGPANRDLVLANLRRFTRLRGPLVLDLVSSDGFGTGLLQALMRTIEDDRDAAGTELTLVVNPALRASVASDERVDVADSVAAALSSITERIQVRRALVFITPDGRLSDER